MSSFENILPFLTCMHVFVHKLSAIKVSCCQFADFLNERLDEFE